MPLAHSIWICGALVSLIGLRVERGDEFLLRSVPEIHFFLEAFSQILGSRLVLLLIISFAWPLWSPAVLCGIAYSATRDTGHAG